MKTTNLKSFFFILIKIQFLLKDYAYIWVAGVAKSEFLAMSNAIASNGSKKIAIVLRDTWVQIPLPACYYISKSETIFCVSSLLDNIAPFIDEHAAET